MFDRWVTLTTLPEEDRKTLVSNIHEEVTSGVQALGGLALAEMGKVFEGIEYKDRDAYLQAAAPVLALAAFDGYLLSLIVQQINPDTANLAGKESTVGLSTRWSKAYQKDQNTSYIDKIDPIFGMMLGKIHELRVNQLLAFRPESVELAYKVTEKLHQYIGWCVYQGYVMGLMEQET